MLAVQKWFTSSCCWWPNLLMSCGLQYCCANSYLEGCIPVREKGRGEWGRPPLSFYRNLKSFFKELLSPFFCCPTGCYIPFSLLILYSNIFVLKETGAQSLVLHCLFLCLHSFLTWAKGFRYSEIYISSPELLSELDLHLKILSPYLHLDVWGTPHNPDCPLQTFPLTAILVNGTLVLILVNSNFLTVAQGKHWHHLWLLFLSHQPPVHEEVLIALL